ncbi:MAG: class I SAM-dependent methyltransferase, partial [Caldilineae bacterium]
DQAAFRRWLETRQAQIEQGELVYFAHQFDFFGSFDAPAKRPF